MERYPRLTFTFTGQKKIKEIKNTVKLNMSKTQVLISEQQSNNKYSKSSLNVIVRFIETTT